MDKTRTSTTRCYRPSRVVLTRRLTESTLVSAPDVPSAAPRTRGMLLAGGLATTLDELGPSVLFRAARVKLYATSKPEVPKPWHQGPVAVPLRGGAVSGEDIATRAMEETIESLDASISTRDESGPS